jgi:predicted kinase
MILMRGIPGSGKSTISQILKNGLENCEILSTDDLFGIGENYKYDQNKIKEYHDLNKSKALKACMDGKNIIIDNTNVFNEHLEKYIEYATKYNYQIFEIAVLAKQEVAYKRQLHRVPYESHKRMNDNLIKSINDKYNNNYTVPENYIEEP